MYCPTFVRKFRVRFLVLFLAVGWFSLHAQSDNRPYVILVSFDGFRYDYAERYALPHFREFIRNGASAEGLIPSFPSKTFPNHYTLVTGLYPDNHGLVDNNFYDPKLGRRYGMKDRDAVEDAAFYGGTPLWQLAQQQGLRSASFFWVGSEAPVHGEYPTYYYRYDETVGNEKRIDQVIHWLKLPAQERPHFISLYFSLVDTEGHNTGTRSAQLQRTVQKADSLLGYLMTCLAAIDLRLNVVLVSDHGMLELRQEQNTYITLSKLINARDSSVIIINGGTHAHLYTRQSDSLYHALKKKENNFTVYRREELPASWRYNHYRTGDILLVAKPGYFFQPVSRSFGKIEYPVFGVHGYHPSQAKEMNGIFYAMGPDIKPGVKVPAFENVHVYPFIAKILRLKAPETDGDLRVLKPVLRE
jgi:predicted AlkP superfamily pyrophosphatase or phosphodiesterase